MKELAAELLEASRKAENSLVFSLRRRHAAAAVIALQTATNLLKATWDDLRISSRLCLDRLIAMDSEELPALLENRRPWRSIYKLRTRIHRNAATGALFKTAAMRLEVARIGLEEIKEERPGVRATLLEMADLARQVNDAESKGDSLLKQDDLFTQEQAGTIIRSMQIATGILGGALIALDLQPGLSLANLPYIGSAEVEYVSTVGFSALHQDKLTNKGIDSKLAHEALLLSVPVQIKMVRAVLVNGRKHMEEDYLDELDLAFAETDLFP